MRFLLHRRVTLLSGHYLICVLSLLLINLNMHTLVQSMTRDMQIIFGMVLISHNSSGGYLIGLWNYYAQFGTRILQFRKDAHIEILEILSENGRA